MSRMLYISAYPLLLTEVDWTAELSSVDVDLSCLRLFVACSNKHVPSFMENAKEIKSKGVSEIIVISGSCNLVLTFCSKIFLSYCKAYVSL